MIGILLLKQIYGLSDEGVWERWVHDPYFQYFTGETFFQHAIPHERLGLSHWRCRLGDRLELLLAESLRVRPFIVTFTISSSRKIVYFWDLFS